MPPTAWVKEMLTQFEMDGWSSGHDVRSSFLHWPDASICALRSRATTWSLRIQKWQYNQYRPLMNESKASLSMCNVLYNKMKWLFLMVPIREKIKPCYMWQSQGGKKRYKTRYTELWNILSLPSLFIFCLQEARLSSNLLKWSWAIFLQVFLNV